MRRPIPATGDTDERIICAWGIAVIMTGAVVDIRITSDAGAIVRWLLIVGTVDVNNWSTLGDVTEIPCDPTILSGPKSLEKSIDQGSFGNTGGSVVTSRSSDAGLIPVPKRKPGAVCVRRRSPRAGCMVTPCATKAPGTVGLKRSESDAGDIDIWA